MYIYIVTDSEDNTILGIYDEERFKQEYKQFTNQTFSSYWDKWIDVVKYEINNSDNNNNIFYPKDIK